MKWRLGIIGIAVLAVTGTVGCNRQPAAPDNSMQLTQPAPSPAVASDPGVRTGTLTPAPAQSAPGTHVIQESPRPVVEETAAVPARPRYVVTKRSKKKSALIIGGTAAAGAAIGAAAGGGKGAGIGALIGGASGLVYDRATAKKTHRVE